MAVDVDRARARPAGSEARRRWPGRRLLLGRPVLTVALVAAAARVLTVAAIAIRTDGVVIPDETQYLALARWIANGQDPARFALGYGASLLHYTPAFVRPLAWCFELFGEGRVPAALFVTTFGILTAALTVALGLRFLRRPFAVAAGLIVALLPSQVLFSSVVLREAMVWACVVGAALAVGVAIEATSVKRLVLSGAAACACILVLGWLRDQTLLVAAWAMLPAAVLSVARFRWWRIAGAVLVLVLVPMAGGIGPGGRTLLATVIPQLGTVRTNLTMSADTAFAKRTILPPNPGGGAVPTGGAPGGPETTITTTTTTLPPDNSVVTGYNGEQYLVDESAAASLRAAPRGFVAVMFRPFPWESGSGSLRVASAESIVWYPLYALSAIGLWQAVKRRLRPLAYPVFLGSALIATSAVLQGNLGTAFRHRGQILWLVAVLAMLGVEHLVDRRAGAST